MVPDEPYEPNQDNCEDHIVGFVEVLTIQFLPVFSHFEADIGEEPIPWDGPDEREQAEAKKRHLTYTCRQAYECAHDGKHPREENGSLPVFTEPFLGGVEGMLREQDITSVTFDEWPSPLQADVPG